MVPPDTDAFPDKLGFLYRERGTLDGVAVVGPLQVQVVPVFIRKIEMGHAIKDLFELVYFFKFHLQIHASLQSILSGAEPGSPFCPRQDSLVNCILHAFLAESGIILFIGLFWELGYGFK